MPTTRQSATEGCTFTASSTSSGKIFSPPELMTTEPRPSNVIDPSSSTLAKSPGTDHIDPLISMNVDADFDSSLYYPIVMFQPTARREISPEPRKTTCAA